MKADALEKVHLHLFNAREQLKRHVYARSEQAFCQGDLDRDNITTIAEIQERQRYIREGFARSIGLEPHSGGEVPVIHSGAILRKGYTIEKLLLESRPGVWISSNLYRPHASTQDAPSAAVLFLCGHHDQGKHDPEYQMVCQILVQAGLVVLAIDPLGQGERLQYDELGTEGSVIGPGVWEHEYAGALCFPLGGSLARYFVTDAMRAMDYLSARPEVDPSRIGVTGNSGGGMQTAMMMMSDSRVAAAAPATFVMSRRAFLYADRSQDAEQIWPGFSALGLDHEDLLLAVAPKPVLVLAAAYDFFPIEGTLATVDRVRRFWEAYGAKERLCLFIDESVHAYTQRMAVKAAVFFAEHLRGVRLEGYEPEVEVLAPSELWCTPEGRLLTAPSLDERRSTIHDILYLEAAALQAYRHERIGAEAGRMAEEYLRHAVFKDRQSGPLHPRLYMLNTHVEELSVYSALWRSQPAMFNYGLVFRDVRRREERLPVTIAVWAGGTHCLQPHWDWIRRTCAEGRSVIVLDVSGAGALTPPPFHREDPLATFEAIHKLTIDLFWLGDSLAALRVYDVLRALELPSHLPLIDSGDIRLYGHGRHGLYARLAAALDNRVSRLEWQEPLPSLMSLIAPRYYEARDVYCLLLPGMLQAFDWPELGAAGAGIS
ncbi:alpha/beta hydrolase family protein [Paenibacillus koleovorans]|uniref:alpha/beta hydrolase family protein n=1 Tax=Paenibacillus koleovorans TaxID=121608 RepID=UPI0013E34A1A|nr:prolyl oligopeptidase family serine peptidase [Paenibacillus koleovorans]